MARKDANPGAKEAAAERRPLALDLRIAGKSYKAIGQQLGISDAQAFRDVKAALDTLAKMELESAAELRRLELERLDKAIKGLMPFVEAGSFAHSNALVKVVDARSKLLGLYAPEQHKILDWRSQAIEDIKAGKLAFDALAAAFDDSLAAELFKLAGVPVE